MHGRVANFYGTEKGVPEGIYHWVDIGVDGKIILK
jgi:hypothetical protein